MTVRESGLSRLLRVAGTLIIVGLIIQAASLIEIHPLAFLTFMFVGGGFLVAGIVTFLLSVVSLSAPAPDDRPSFNRKE